jgi:hypothetical protein
MDNSQSLIIKNRTIYYNLQTGMVQLEIFPAKNAAEQTEH